MIRHDLSNTASRAATGDLAARLQSPATAGAALWRDRVVASGGQRVDRPGMNASLNEAPAPPEAGSLDESARVEAVLFLAREPLSTRELAKRAGLADGTKAQTALKRLRRKLARRGSAIEPVEVGGGVQMLTRPQAGRWLAGRGDDPHASRLSAPALETLVVAAYRQPTLRAEIEAVRGVQCGEILKVLLERDLLRIVGRSDALGRPYLYGTTRKFLRIFGLQRLEQLPPIDQTLSAAGEADLSEPS